MLHMDLGATNATLVQVFQAANLGLFGLGLSIVENYCQNIALEYTKKTQEVTFPLRSYYLTWSN